MNAARGAWSWALAAPLVAFLLVLVAYPLAGLLGNASLETWRDPYFQGRLLWTFVQALVSTVVVVCVGTSSAVLFAAQGFRGRRTLESLLGVPFVVPVIVAAIGWVALFGARGVIADLSNTFWLLLIGNVFYNYGVFTRALTVALEGVDRDLEGAARLEGATGWQVFRFVTLPHALPTLRSSALLVLLYCFASFGVPLLLAPARFATLEVEIYQALQGARVNEAAALAWWQLGIGALFTGVYARLQHRATDSSATYGSRRTQARGWTRVWLGVHVAFALTLTLAPLLAVAVRSVWDDAGFTLQNFAALLEPPRGVYSSDVFSALLNNLRFLVGALLVAVPLGIAHAVAVWRTRSAWLEGLTLLPLALSAALLGIAYIVAFGALTASPWLLVVAYALVAYPFIARGTLEGLRALDMGVLEAARVDGAGARALLTRIIMPLVQAPARVGIAFAAAVVIGEFGATLVLQRPQWTTLTTLVYGALGRPGGLGVASAAAVVLLAFTVTVFSALNPRSR